MRWSILHKNLCKNVWLGIRCWGEYDLNLNPRVQEATVMDDERLARAEYRCGKRIYMLCCVDVQAVWVHKGPRGYAAAAAYLQNSYRSIVWVLRTHLHLPGSLSLSRPFPLPSTLSVWRGVPFVIVGTLYHFYEFTRFDLEWYNMKIKFNVEILNYSVEVVYNILSLSFFLFDS